MYTREQWGAKPPKRILTPGTIEGIIQHWVGADVPAEPTVARVFSWLRNTQASEMAGIYNDLSYSFVVDGLGRIYEGHDARVRQGASNAYNSRTLSICYFGGPGTPLTAAAKASIEALCQWIAAVHPVTSYVWPHRKVRPSYTQCPGDTIINWLPSIVLRPAHLEAPAKVIPMFMPALALEPIAAELRAPNGGVWLLAPSGALYAFGGAPGIRGANGQDYFIGRTAARLEPFGNGVTIVATSGERYDYPV